MLLSLALVALAGGFVGASTWAVVQLQRQELAASKIEFETYKQSSDERIAAANKDAAEARLETERLRSGFAWRIPTDEQKARIADKMRKYAGQKFTVLTYRADDPEASNFGARIQQALEAAGWAFEASGPLNWLDTGVSVETGRTNEKTISPIAAELVAALNAEKFTTKQVLHPKYNAHPEMIFVVVGKKPPSALEIPELAK